MPDDLQTDTVETTVDHETVATSLTGTDEAVGQPDASTEPSSEPSGDAAPLETPPPANAGVGAKAAGAQPPSAATSAHPNPKPDQTLDPRLKAALDEKAQWGRERAEMQRSVEQLRREREQWQQQEAARRAEAERRNLRRWDPAHPDHGKFRSLLDKAQLLNQQVRAIEKRSDLSPEQKAGLIDQMAQQLSPEEQQELQAHQEMNRDFLLNPAANAREIAVQAARDQIRDAFAQFQQHQQAVQDVARVDRKLLEQQGDYLRQQLQSGVPYDAALEMATMRQQLADLHGRTTALSQEQEAARTAAKAAAERERLAKGRASITRDPKGVGTPDYYSIAKKEAAEKGITPDSPRFMRLLEDVRQRHES